MTDDTRPPHGSLRPEPQTPERPASRPTGTDAMEPIPSAQRDRWRTDQYKADGRDPNYAHDQPEEDEMIPSAGGPATGN